MKVTVKNIILFPFNVLYKLSPELELKLMFRIKQGYPLNLKNPETFSEKIQWIKLYDKNELIPKCCDKYTVREYVANSGCQEILNTLYWCGTDPDKIPYDTLPEQFVIKVTQGSTFNIIVKDKSNINKREIADRLKRWMRAKYISCYGEWFYGIESPQIIIEQYLDDGHKGGIYDYKVLCFNGKAKLIDVHADRFKTHKRNIYDREWNSLSDVYMKYEHFEGVEKPAVLKKMIEYAEILSKPFYHARVDFYIVNNRIYFGELTFTAGSGFDKITPLSFDKEMGSWLSLPIENI